MSFHSRRAYAVFWKDFLDLRKNKGLLFSMMVLPALLVAVPTGIVHMYAASPNDPSLRQMAIFYDPLFPASADPALFMIEKTLADWFGLFLLMPVFVPILIASQSVAGEKEKRTLEPLLASPVTAAEILAGKSLAALVPAMGITLLAFAVFCVGIDWAAWPVVQRALLPNGMWLFGVFIIAPLFAFFGNGVAVLVSARVGDPRLAQQISALVTLPLLGLVGSQLAGLLRADSAFYAVQGGVIVLLDLAILWASLRLFDRDRLISRWV